MKDAAERAVIMWYRDHPRRGGRIPEAGLGLDHERRESLILRAKREFPEVLEATIRPYGNVSLQQVIDSGKPRPHRLGEGPELTEEDIDAFVRSLDEPPFERSPR